MWNHTAWGATSFGGRPCHALLAEKSYGARAGFCGALLQAGPEGPSIECGHIWLYITTAQ